MPESPRELSAPADASAPAVYDAEFAAQLAAADAAATDHVLRDRPANTTRSYSSDWKSWERFCTAWGVPASAGSRATLVAFAEWLAGQGYANATVERKVYGTVVALSLDHGVELSRADRQVLRQAIKNSRRKLAQTGERRGRGKAKALSVAELRSISAALPTTVAGVRDRALLTLGFGMAARRSELASLLVGDIEDCADGLCISLAWSKTGDVGEPIRVPFGTSAVTCPVQAWRTYRAALATELGRELGAEEPAFRQVDRHGNLGGALSAHSIGTTIRKAAERAGVEHITGHSLRAGLATAAARSGHDAKTISEHGRWSVGSPVVYGYIRHADAWENNPVKGIGL